ncbi:NACHT domain-containing protein [Streptomyces sp. NPDC054833]
MVLGEPGAGKTILLIRLLLALLEHHPPGGPVPVLFPLASWDPARQDLYTWMTDELVQDHPALQAPASAQFQESGTGTQARALLEQRLILPILDGLDELPQAVRGRALHAINQVLPAGRPLVLSSRTAEYRNALTTRAGTIALLNGAAGVRLLPLDPAKAAVYLERDAGGPDSPAAARWRRVVVALGTDIPAAQALSTPLGLFLARSIYTPRPDEQLTELPDPDELLDRARFPTRQDIDTHLFAAFIPAAYRPHPHHPTRWTAQQAQHTLAFLACHLQHTLDGTPNLAWWQLPKAFPYGQPLAVGLAAGIIGALPLCLVLGLWFGFPTGLGAGLAAGILSALVAPTMAYPLPDRAPGQRKPSSGIRWSGTSWRTRGLAYFFGAMFVLAWVNFGFIGGLIGGLIGALAFGLMRGLRPVHTDLDKAVGPGAVLARDQRTLWAFTLLGGFTGVLTAVLWYVLLLIPFGGRAGLGQLGDTGVLVFAFGLPVGLMLGLRRSVWMEFLVARLRLAVMGRVPWRLMSFLADAHERRGVLRQVGAVYQFRHIDLQRHLAGPYTSISSATSRDPSQATCRGRGVQSAFHALADPRLCRRGARPGLRRGWSSRPG